MRRVTSFSKCAAAPPYLSACIPRGADELNVLVIPYLDHDNPDFEMPIGSITPAFDLLAKSYHKHQFTLRSFFFLLHCVTLVPPLRCLLRVNDASAPDIVSHSQVRNSNSFYCSLAFMVYDLFLCCPMVERDRVFIRRQSRCFTHTHTHTVTKSDRPLTADRSDVIPVNLKYSFSHFSQPLAAGRRRELE